MHDKHCPLCEQLRDAMERPYCDDCMEVKLKAFAPLFQLSANKRLLWLSLFISVLVAVIINIFYPSPTLLVLYAVPVMIFTLLVMNAYLVMIFGAILIAVCLYLSPDPFMWEGTIVPFVSYVFISLLVRKLVLVSKRNHEQSIEYEELFMNTIFSFARTVDARDPYTAFHSRNVANYSKKIAAELGLSHDETDSVYLAGIIHDVGKIGTPEHILKKEGRLTNEEYEIMKKHAEDGYQIIRNIRRLEVIGVTKMVRHHHERMDGRGYPLGLKEQEIPLGARIIGVADAFDAMTTTRSYRQKLPQETAVQELQRNSGTQFDQQVVRAFMTILQREGLIQTAETKSYGNKIYENSPV